MDYKLTLTVYSDKAHPPIMFSVAIPEQLAIMLMSQPVTATSLSVSRAGNLPIDKTGLLDFR